MTLGHERMYGVDRGEDARRRDDLVSLPGVLRVQRHVLDEPHLVPGLSRPHGEVDDLVVVRPADHDAVDLDRRESGRFGRPHAGEHLVEGVASGHLREAVPQQRVARDRGPVDAGLGEGSREPVQEHAVRGQRDVEIGTDLAEHPDQHGEIRATRGSPPVTFRLRNVFTGKEVPFVARDQSDPKRSPPAAGYN